MVLERSIPQESFADRDVQIELDRLQVQFETVMSEVFGVRFENLAVASCAPNTVLEAQLIIKLIQIAKTTLAEQRKLLLDADKVTAAKAVDTQLGESQDEIILPDLERALEFLVETNPRKNSDSMRKVWRKLLESAREDVEQLSPMPYRKPPIIFPRGLQAPLFGVYDRSIWSQQRDYLNKETLKRIDEVDSFVQTNWFSQS